MPNQYGVAASAAPSYQGLSAQDAITLWQQTHKALAQKYGIDPSNKDPQYLTDAMNKMTPDDWAAYTPNAIQTENPDAFKLFKTGIPSEDGKTIKYLDPATGDWGSMKKTGLFSHPETWIQLGLGGALAAPFVAPALAATFGGSTATAAAPAAATTASATGAGTAATVAGGVAPVAAKAGGIASWLTGPTGSLINAGIAEGGNIFAGIKQANAEKDAAALQDKQFEEALQAEKEKEQYGRNNYAAYLARLQGFSDTGNAANGRLAAFMGQGRMPTNTEGPPLHPSATPPPAPFQPPPQGAPMGQAQGQTVKMVGPDGSLRDIPADQVQKFTAMGAKVAQMVGA